MFDHPLDPSPVLYHKKTKMANVTEKYGPQKRYAAKYQVRISFSFNKRTEADILEKLDTVDNKAGYIKSLIRADIAKGK